MINSLPGTSFRASAPLESMMRGSSGMKGSLVTRLPAAMIQFLKATIFFLAGRCSLFVHFAGRQRNFQVVRIQELAVTLDNVYFTAFSHTCQAGG